MAQEPNRDRKAEPPEASVQEPNPGTVGTVFPASESETGTALLCAIVLKDRQTLSRGTILTKNRNRLSMNHSSHKQQPNRTGAPYESV